MRAARRQAFECAQYLAHDLVVAGMSPRCITRFLRPVLRQVSAYSFDIILADYSLDDGRDGQQLLEELRQQNMISLSTVYMLITAERAYRNVVSVAELAR